MSDMYRRAREECWLDVEGVESPRQLFYMLLVDRGHPHPSDVLTALDDLGLEVTES